MTPQKLAGQCGKLKCCLNYELDGYLEALNAFPRRETKIKTEKGIAVCQKVDIFKGLMWYAYEGEWMNWFTINTEDANEMIKLNADKKLAISLEHYALEDEDKLEVKLEFENVVGQDSLTRFDKPKGNKRRRNSKNRNQRNKSKSNQPNNSTGNNGKGKRNGVKSSHPNNSSEGGNKNHPNKKRKPANKNRNNNKKGAAADTNNQKSKPQNNKSQNNRKPKPTNKNKPNNTSQKKND